MVKPHAIPFRTGVPIQDPFDFVGRTELLRDISNAMLNLRNISLHGERRTGKTSLLLYLVHSTSSSVIGLPETHIPVYFDFQDFSDASAINVWQAVTNAVAEQIKRRHPDKEAESEQFLAIAAENRAHEMPSTGFRRALDYLKTCGFKVHLLFDEFERTKDNPNLGESFYNTLRSLPTDLGNVSYVIATRTGLEALQPKYDRLSSPFFNIFTRVTLGPFQEDEIYRLIFGYFSRAGLNISLAERLCAESAFLHKVTGYHPHFLQTLCYHLCTRLDEPDWPLGQAQQEALRAFEKDSEPHFEYYWQVSSKEEQEIIRKLASRQPVDWDRPEIMASVEDLEDRCLVVQTGEAERRWRLFSSAFGNWVNRATLPKELPSLRRQLAEAYENLSLIQEHKSKYVMETDIPLHLLKDERRWKRQITELELQITESRERKAKPITKWSWLQSTTGWRLVTITASAFAIITILVALIVPFILDRLLIEDSFLCRVQVQTADTNEAIPGAEVRIDTGGGKPQLVVNTDSYGFASFSIDASDLGQQAELIVEAGGYMKHRQYINLVEGDTILIVWLEPGTVTPAMPTSELVPTPMETATPTPTQTPSPTPTPTLSPGLEATALQRAVIFAAPYAGSQTLGGVSEGEQVTMLGRSEYGEWFYIQDDQGVEGFVYAPRFEWAGDFELLPVITSTPVPPRPTATPTAPATPYLPLELELWPVSERCGVGIWIRDIYMGARGGDGVYMYYWNDELKCGPQADQCIFEVHSTGGAIIGVGKVVSGDGQEVEKPLYVYGVDCP